MSGTEFSVNKVAGLMAEHKLTQDDIALLWGVNRRTVSRKLNGHTPLTVDELSKLIDKFYKDANYFFVLQVS